MWADNWHRFQSKTIIVQNKKVYVPFPESEHQYWKQFEIENVSIKKVSKQFHKLEKKSKVDPRFVKFLEDTLFTHKLCFPNFLLWVRFYCNAECRCEKYIEFKGRNFENLNHQKRISFVYFLTINWHVILPYGCHQFLGKNWTENYVQKTLKLDVEKFIKVYIYKEIKIETKINIRDERRYYEQPSVSYLNKNFKVEIFKQGIFFI